MQVICPYSGEVLIRSNLLLGFDYEEVHPIFRVPRNKLLTFNLVHKFDRAASEQEKRLYFLALLHSTDLVTFSVPAKPSTKVANKNFYQVLGFAQWMDYAMLRKEDVGFPGYIVRQDNADMENLHLWVEALLEVQNKFLARDRDIERRRSLLVENQRILNEISYAVQQGKVFTSFLARWVLDQTGLDKHPKAQTFYTVLKTNKEEAYGIDRNFLLALKDLITDRIDANHPLFPHIVGQLRALINAQRTTTPDFEIFYENEIVISQEGDGTQTTVQQVAIADSSARKLFDMTGSEEEPIQKVYLAAGYSLNQWQKAKALWSLAQMKKQNPSG